MSADQPAGLLTCGLADVSVCKQINGLTNKQTLKLVCLAVMAGRSKGAECTSALVRKSASHMTCHIRGNISGNKFRGHFL
ncbi:hypothetical protein [Capsulimonas corticalis]|uniref:hypothetical protein n=1 Tax=Capsulimonas corticalis TaxID=2219043 RepID=UPI00260D5597|nr:hypothetical protein [Capsulimonas corticalis]